MKLFRSTLNKGASWHTWPDAQGYKLWPLPHDGKAGDYRNAADKPTQAHGNGIHSARWRALAYWFGPMNFVMDIETSAQKPADHSLENTNEDIIVARKARLEKSLPMTLEQWQDVSLQCAGFLKDFPKYYNYEGRYIERADLEDAGLLKDFPKYFNYEDRYTELAAREAFEHPKAYPIFRNAAMKYDWAGAVQKTADFFIAVRSEKKYKPNSLQVNIKTLSGKYKDNATEISNHLHQIQLQSFAHFQSVARCEEYEHHSDAMIHAMRGLHALNHWIMPWTKPASTLSKETPDTIATNGHGTLKTIVQNVNRAYRATGAEQYRLMMTDSRYTMETGLGPLLAGLPYLPEKNLNGHMPADLAGRGIMLKMGEVFANAFDVNALYQADMEPAQPLAPRFEAIVNHQRRLDLD